jgi:hypothetical protein
MKRDYTEHEGIPPDDILTDIPQAQLAGIGAVALSYNYAENTVNRMMFLCMGIPIGMYRDVVTRINGVDGKIEIVKRGAKEQLNLPCEIVEFISVTLGDGHFKLLKKYRDAVIHARIVNKVTGVGELLESRGRHTEVLLTKDALMGLYKRLKEIRMELACLLMVMDAKHWINQFRDPNDLDKAKHEEQIPAYFALARQYRDQRLALSPLPEFPDAVQLHELESQPGAEPQETMTGVLTLGTLGLAEVGRTATQTHPPSLEGKL